MKKPFVILSLLLLPLLAVSFPKTLPKGYVAFGVLPQPENMIQVLKKVVQPQVYQGTLAEISAFSNRYLGLDILKDSLDRLGVDSSQYLYLYLHPESRQVGIEITSKNPEKLLKALKSALTSQWGKLKERKKGMALELYTTHPSYKNQSVFCKMYPASLFVSNTAAGALILEQPKETLDETLHGAASRYLEQKKPFLTVYLSKETAQKRLEASALESDFFLAVNQVKNQFTLDFILAQARDIDEELTLPPFLTEVPLMLVNTTFSAQQMLDFAEKSGNPQLQFFLNSLDLKNSLGKKAFVSMRAFNYLEIMQGLYQNTDVVLGIELRNATPYESMLEMLKNQAAAQGRTAVRSDYQGNALFSFSSPGTSSPIREFYFLLMKDWILVGTRAETLQKAADAYLKGTAAPAFAVSSKNLILYADLQRILAQMPMITSYLTQNGVRADQFRFLTGNYDLDKANGLLNISLAIHFKD